MFVETTVVLTSRVAALSSCVEHSPAYHLRPITSFTCCRLCSPNSARINCCRRETARCFVSVSSTIRRVQILLLIYGCVQLNSVLLSSLRRRRPSQLFAQQHSSIASYLSGIAIIVPTQPASTPPLAGPCRNIAMTFGIEILEWRSYQKVKFF